MLSLAQVLSAHPGVSIALLFTTVLSACGSSAPSQLHAPMPIRPAVVDRVLSQSDERRIDTAFITGKVLTLRFRWANACTTDTFDLVHSGVSTRSIPPQLPVFLHRKPTQNTCPGEQLLERQFDLSPLVSDRMGAVFSLSGYRGQRLLVPRGTSESE
jgi:hypothetical protein